MDLVQMSCVIQWQYSHGQKSDRDLMDCLSQIYNDASNWGPWMNLDYIHMEKNAIEIYWIACLK